MDRFKAWSLCPDLLSQPPGNLNCREGPGPRRNVNRGVQKLLKKYALTCRQSQPSVCVWEVPSVDSCIDASHDRHRSNLEMAVGASPQLASQQLTTKTSQRLVFLDVVRGITIAFMILVNNNGNEHLAYAPLSTPTGMDVHPPISSFPTCLFLVGITIVLSTASRIARGESRSPLLRHALQRAAILFALGILIHGFPSYPLARSRNPEFVSGPNGSISNWICCSRCVNKRDTTC
jgi:hypothetical protein